MHLTDPLLAFIEVPHYVAQRITRSRRFIHRVENSQPVVEHGYIPVTNETSSAMYSASPLTALQFPRLMLFLESLKSDKSSEGYQAVAQSKTLGRQIKALRVPQIMSLEFGNHVPSKQLADELVEAYLRTYETIHRVLHIPSFRLEYARYWQNPKGARQAFVIQLQLCMAIGAVLHDDHFSLRSLAVRWVYEARFWLFQPSEKSRMNLSGLQICCLVHLARDVCGVGSDLVWASAGSLMRMALYIGLHRDPDHLPKMSLLAAETRRRVWATILEILVQSSM